ncbi:RNA-directed DNA polymerase, eukaryota, Reverse transcriptase zinc-binding domain protein [Artemisia annua]|uniref:RNA-directed DNA polymerase, eukaryota, Reverse transcriptase zinc-binding domain protein n=1 Tax=Artemisia annua TaxID=35608 RepID=A0A2U1PDQ4_ARTAN|nr:RNA-directed DNA polymerase, eukaryota, Reverse transcriptase zinc-binding domain protein [Artemisia annua]
MIWMEIHGRPLCAWGSNAYKKVANHFGKFMFFYSDVESCLGMARVCIATTRQSIISELANVVINEVSYAVQVQEVGSWSINITDDTDSTDSVDTHSDEECRSVNADDIVQPFEEDFEPLHSHNTEKSVHLETDTDGSQSSSTVNFPKVPEPLNVPSEENISDGSVPPGFENADFTNKDPPDGSHPPPRESTTVNIPKVPEPLNVPSEENISDGRMVVFLLALKKKKDIKAFSIIDEMNRVIEVGGALGGLKKRRKRTWIKDMCSNHNIQFLGIQETKMTKLELFRLKSMWGNFKFDYACSMARGRLGGLISMWDSNVFMKSNIWCGDNYVIVKGKWKNSIEDYYLINVYGPQHQPAKANLWNFLRSGDAAIFNSFIQDVGLLDLPMGGKMFTWMNKAGTKLSKIDRFLISEDVLESHSDILVTILDKLWSDHNPILLHCKKIDFGPTPFRIFHSWFDRPGFEDVVKAAWVNLSREDVGAISTFHTKLKGLKLHLKQWHSQIKSSECSRKRDITDSLRTIEDLIDAGNATDEDRAQRIRSLHELDNLEKMDSQLDY